MIVLSNPEHYELMTPINLHPNFDFIKVLIRRLQRYIKHDSCYNLPINSHNPFKCERDTLKQYYIFTKPFTQKRGQKKKLRKKEQTLSALCFSSPNWAADTAILFAGSKGEILPLTAHSLGSSET